MFSADSVNQFASVLKTSLAVFLSVVAAACASPAAQSTGAPPAAEVTAAKAIERSVSEWDEFTGRLEAVHNVEVRPRVSGLLAAVNFTEGAIVREGDVLFEIDARPFQAEVDRLRAELVRARATLTRAGSERDRAKRLATENAMSAEEHDRRLSSADEAEANVAAVQAALRVAELNLEFTSVTAPISGRVGHAIVTEGNLVAGGTTLLTTVVSLNPIYATFEVDEQTYLKMPRANGQSFPRVRANGQDLPRAGASGQAVPRASAASRGTIGMALAGEQEFPREGRLNFLDNQLNPATGTIRVRAVFQNGDGALTPGLFVRLRMKGSRAGNGILIQDQAIGTDLDKRFVYVVGNDSAVAYRAVTLGPMVDGLRVVRSGVKPNELVVVNGLQRVRPGAKVDAKIASMEISEQVGQEQVR